VVTLQLDLKKAQPVSITILSVDGKKQQANYAGKLLQGNQTISLNTTQLAAGLYFVSIETPEGRLVKKLNVIR
jgi:hypothetical protein